MYLYKTGVYCYNILKRFISLQGKDFRRFMNLIKLFLSRYKYLVFALFLLVIFQFIILQAGCLLGSFEALEYIFRPPKINTFFQNYAILFGINILAWVILRRFIYACFLTSICVAIFAVIGIFKMYYLTDPILWYDLAEIDNALIAIYPTIPFYYFILGAIVLLLLFFVAYKLNRVIPSVTLTLKGSFSLALVGLFLFGSGIIFCYPLPNYAQMLQSPKRTYRYAGVPVVFTSFFLKGQKYQEKTHYSKANIESICHEILKDYTPQESVQSNQPNLVLIVQESMVDPLNLKIKLPIDPLAKTRHFDSNIQCVTPISPTFGSGSWNTDFEMCTGFSAIAFRENSSFSKSSGLREPYPSIAHVLKSYHYQTYALIPCQQSLFSYKDQFHHLMGFENYQDIESLFPEIEAMNETSDSQMYDYILNILYKSDTQPKLIYAQLLENHWPYKTKHISSDNMSTAFEFAKAISYDFFEYLNRLEYSDKIFVTFLNRVKKIQRPTLIYTFGDHVPPLSQPVQRHLKLTYTEKKLSKMTQVDSRLMVRRHGTIGVYWANEQKLSRLPDEMSHFFMGYYLYKDLHISHPFYTHFMGKMLLQFEAVMGQDTIKLSTGKWVKKYPLPAQKIWEMYDLILFDMCYGQQYAKALLFPEVKPSNCL